MTDTKLNIFVDGTWLFKVCSPYGVMANITSSPNYPFSIDWNSLNNVILNHVQQTNSACSGIGDSYIATSIFDLPHDFSSWSNNNDNIDNDSIEKTQRVVDAKERVVTEAIQASYSTDAVFRPPIKPWIIEKLENGTYQEKMVDSAVIALLVRSAITKPNDFHAVITGDSDIIPAIKVAYPEFTKNVVMVFTHPDEKINSSRTSSRALMGFEFDIEPIFLQDIAKDIYASNNVYNCVECGKIFGTLNPVPKRARPRCSNCR